MSISRYVSVLVLGLGLLSLATSASAQGNSAGMGMGGGDPPIGHVDFVDVDIAYVKWGGPSRDNHVQIRVQVSVSGEDVGVEADVDIRVDVVGGSDPAQLDFFGTTGLDDGGLVRFNIQNAPIGCYTTTVTGVLTGGIESVVLNTTQDPLPFCK